MRGAASVFVLLLTLAACTATTEDPVIVPGMDRAEIIDALPTFAVDGPVSLEEPVPHADAQSMFEDICLSTEPDFDAAAPLARHGLTSRSSLGTFLHERKDLSVKISTGEGRTECSMAFRSADAPDRTALQDWIEATGAIPIDVALFSVPEGTLTYGLKRGKRAMVLTMRLTDGRIPGLAGMSSMKLVVP